MASQTMLAEMKFSITGTQNSHGHYEMSKNSSLRRKRNYHRIITIWDQVQSFGEIRYLEFMLMQLIIQGPGLHNEKISPNIVF